MALKAGAPGAVHSQVAGQGIEGHGVITETLDEAFGDHERAAAEGFVVDREADESLAYECHKPQARHGVPLPPQHRRPILAMRGDPGWTGTSLVVPASRDAAVGRPVADRIVGKLEFEPGDDGLQSGPKT